MDTFEEIRMKTIRAAQNIQKRGLLKPKQVVGIMAPDLPDLAPMVFASICLGCPVLSMPRVSKRMLSKTEPAVIFCGIEDYDDLFQCLRELGLKTKLFTFGAIKGDSELADSLLAETGIEDSFV